MIYILFGPPGVGKTYIGDLISKSKGFNFFDADELISPEVKSKLISGTYSQTDRNQFIILLEKTIRRLTKNSNNLVIAEAFTKELNRQKFAQSFPEAQFFLVLAPHNLARERAVNRMKIGEHVIDEKSFERLWNDFDTPEITYKIIDNSGVMDEDIINRFNSLIQES